MTRNGSGVLVIATAVAGAVAAIVLGLLTFGAQATSRPHAVPVAVTTPDQAPPQLTAAAERVAHAGGDALDWHVAGRSDGRAMLENQDVYGVLELGSGPEGASVTVVTSGAVNPTGTQLAQQVLTEAGNRLAAAMAAQGGAELPPGAAPQVRAETVHDTGAAGRMAPLGISALAWVGGLAGAALLAVQVRRGTLRPRIGARLAHLALSGTLVTAVLVGFLALWDSSLDLGWAVVGFLALTVTAFAAVQAALLRWLGIPAMAVLGPLYLLAPSVASQVPEMLDPAYRTLLWSWTPFRFSTEGLRSLLLGTPDTAHVTTALWVLGGMLAAGLVGVLWPRRRDAEPAPGSGAPADGPGSTGQEAEPDSPGRVVDVGVDQADRLPRAEGESAAEYGDGRVRRYQRR
ncbi:hypothetical protein ACZ91_47610 [Streptomyces regensis]|uniref:Uncharacterized protein n=1 Tax=Prauserella rugosa TaxID=43354 RepID=A0A660CA79_9PSEU|nr:hypothetical protein [Prauserella rugosa]KMS84472.1 hypothetical protein ACZ91_47610 [Streptomyces regensis]TWH20216.1 hypothetical protein JD82_02058 [Prauserella rugosa]